MKRLFLINVATFIILLIVACDPPPPPPPPGTSEIPEANTLTLTSALNTMPEITQVEFLIDNSNSVEDVTKRGCGEELGGGRFEFARFITGILRASIPVQYSQNLFVGVGTFGDNFISLISPMAISTSVLIPTPNAPTNNTRYSLGVQGALSKMYEQGQLVQKRYLIIITDGEMETESIEKVEEELKEQTITHNDPNLHIYIALLCPRNSQVWFDTIHHLDVADVFVGLENVTKQLFDDLNGFLPVTSELILSSNGQNTIQVAGDATSVSFSYWSPDTDPGSYLGIYNTSVNFSKSLNELEPYSYNGFPLPGCPPQSFTIDPPSSSNWFLFVQPKTFQDLKFSMKSSNGGSIEIVNDDPLDFQFEISDSLSNVDLNKWKDCFSAQLIWATFNQPNQVNSGEVNLVPCEGIQFLCYTERQWSPRFADMGDMEMKIRLNALDGTTWESKSRIFPIKFRAEYDTFNSVPFTVHEQGIVQKGFVFRDVSSTSQIDIYLASSTGKLDDDRCPNLTHVINGLKAHQLILMPVQECNFANLSDTADGNRVCISHLNQAPLKYVYTLHAYARIAKVDCQYDQLFFEWHSDENTKQITWWCDFLQNKDCISISEPTIIIYQ